VNPEDAIEAAELAEAETAYRHRLARQMYQAGQRAGFEAGYRQANADMAARWAEIARPVARGISYAELEERRYLIDVLIVISEPVSAQLR
jgi:flagellar biosynthesis/type III secretory pathway protein FliH